MSDSDNKNNSIPDVDDGEITPAFHPNSGMWYGLIEKPFMRRSAMLIVMIVVIAGFACNEIMSNANETSPAVISPRGGGFNRSTLFIDGDRNDVVVRFEHDMHKERLGGKDSCVECHHIHNPNDYNTACWQCHTQMESETQFFEHALHTEKLGNNKSCEKCHDPSKPHWRTNSKHCSQCHEQDMNIMSGEAAIEKLLYAPGYVNAMHGMCIDCHEKQAGAPTECAGCHGDDNVGQKIN